MNSREKPLLDYFITEKENANILSQIKNNSSLLQKTIILNLNDFKKELLKECEISP